MINHDLQFAVIDAHQSDEFRSGSETQGRKERKKLTHLRLCILGAMMFAAVICFSYIPCHCDYLDTLLTLKLCGT